MKDAGAGQLIFCYGGGYYSSCNVACGNFIIIYYDWMIMTIKFLSILMVLIGATFLFLSFSPAIRVWRNVSGRIRQKWLIILYLMGFFILGYLAFDIILIRNLPVPLEIVTGGVFLGGAVFVYIIINISMSTVTAQQKAEEAILVAKDDWENTFNAVTDMVTVHDTDFNIIRANPAAREILGLQLHEEIPSAKCFMCYHGTEKPPSECASCQSLQTREPSTVEMFEPHLNKHLEIRAMPRFGNDHRLIGLIHVVRDITDRKQAEEALQAGRLQLKAILDNIPDIAWLKDKESRLIAVNEPFGKSCGFEPEDLVGKTDLDIWPRDLAERYRADDKEVMESGKRKQVEEPLKDTEGRILWIETIKTPIYDEYGDVSGTAGIARDITERKKAEEERHSLAERLNRAEKMESLGLLAGGVAHDLNNVLGIVVGYAEILLMGADKSSPIRSKLVNIIEGGQKAATIVGDLLTLARRGVSGRDVLNLNKIIADWQQSPEFKQLSSFHSSVQIKTELEHDLLNISGSSVHLGKTIFNLVSNASEAMPKGGVLTIKTANQYLDKPIQGYDEIQEGDYVVLSVSDTGEGISDADLKRIFEPFYTKKVMGRSGTGLGLAVVWGTVKDHNGYINVQSEEGKGSIFTLYFPVTREKLSVDHVALPISEYMGKGESILIVDDVKGQQALATVMLKELNYSVTSVSSGEEAVTYLKEHKADLMVLDMIMDPGMDGLDTYKKVLEIRPEQKAIIVSGFSESERVKAAKSLGAGAYVKKPYVFEKLGLAVRKELDRAT
jgi:PAS domain S-box-containing protein